jgi:hypothetical protein
MAAIPSGLLQRKCACSGTPGPTGECAACRRKRLGVQRKLTISQPGDKYEREADRVADQVMRMPEPRLQRQTESDEEDEEEELLQTKPLAQRNVAGQTAVETAPPLVHEVLNSPGHPLDPTTRDFMEPRFGHNFSQIKIHSGEQAAKSAQAVNARAYTIGKHIVFGHRQYRPESLTGQQLIAHELAHAVQQSGAPQGQPMLYRWKIDGNTATADKSSDYLGRLATQVGAKFRDWKCIKPVRMQTHESGKAPGDFNKRYERYVQIGDEFDISNLTATNGETLNLHLFDDTSEKLDADLAKLFYPGSQSTVGADADIDSTSGSGSNPIGQMVIFGHAGGNSMWGDASTFTPADLKSEEPEHSFTLASVGLFPRRCWFTRDAQVRSVGCDSTAWGKDFAAAYLRKGAKVITTTESVWSRCRGSAYDPATDTCTAHNGVDFRDAPVAPARILEGPFWSAADFHGGSYWTTLDGNL